MYSIDAGLEALGRHPGPLLGYLAALPVVTVAIGLPVRAASKNAAAVFATIPTHLAVLQGVSVLGVLAYSAFFLHQNLLALNVFVHYAPLLSAVAALAASNAVAPFDAQPGFDRLSGLCMLAALAFGAFFVLDRLHFFAGVFMSLASLTGIFLGLCAIARLAMKRVRGPE
ncbi:MAG: hypothetical protein HY078_16105 [Elusimicrobia bacterium]|nr:hypothetical protein [Elusimicrobiota bacterium]